MIISMFRALEDHREHGCTILRVTVEYIGHIKNITDNKREEEIEAGENVTVTDLLAQLSKKYGEPFKKAIYEPKGSDVKPNYIITINGYLLNQLKGLETKLKKGDHVTLLPIVSGG
jgi:MoaD family protein